MGSERGSQTATLVDRALGIQFGCHVGATDQVHPDASRFQPLLKLA